MVRNTLLLGAAISLSFTALACAAREPEIRRDEAAHQRTARFDTGAGLYSRYCALCHGPDATGYAADHAPSLVSSTFLQSATDEFIGRGIREGRPNTAMAGYAKVRGGPLEDEDVAAIIAFLRDRDPSRVKLDNQPVLGDVSNGQVVYNASCKRCHGTQINRADAVHLANAMFLSAATDSFLRYAVAHGRPGTPMPAFEGVLREDEIDDVVAYIRSWSTRPDPVRRAPPEPPPLGQFIINPKGPNPEFTLREDRYVPIADVLDAIQQKKRIVIIDARATSDWYAMHIPGSISVPYYGFSRLDSMPKDGTWITAYCACPHHASGAVVDELRKRGYTHTAVLDEGILEWRKRNYPIESMPLPEDTSAESTPVFLPPPGAVPPPGLTPGLMGGTAATQPPPRAPGAVPNPHTAPQLLGQPAQATRPSPR